MKIKRGLFRLWVIFLIIFSGITLLFSINSITQEFSTRTHIEKGQLMVPINCALARGSLPNDYIDNLEGNFCWYSLSKFRLLYPEYNDLNDEELTNKLYAKADIKVTSPKPWITLLKTLAFGFGIPIALLILGRLLIWAISGFRETSITMK